MITGLPLIIPELEWMLIGEKLSGEFIMYRDLWAIYAPFASGTYSIIVGITGKSPITFSVISLILVYFQALFVNFTFNSNNFYNEKTSFPGLLYIIFSCLFFDLYTLPPVLFALSFLLPALYIVIIQLRYRSNNEGMLYLGILTGLATLFYVPSSFFLLTFVLSLLLFTAAGFRKYILMLTGFLIPLLLTALFYFYFDALDYLWQNLITSFFTISATKYVEIKLIILLSIIPSALLLLGLFSVSGRTVYINYQYNVFKIMMLWLIIGLLTILFTMHFAPYQLYIFIPAIAYFGTHFFLLSRSRLITELAFWTIIIFVPLVNAGFTYGFLEKKESNALDKLIVGPSEYQPSVSLERKKILVIGTNIELYKNSQLATPYFNWDLSKRHFLDLKNFETITEIYKNFQKDLPEVIIDQKNVMGDVFRRIPILEEKYTKLPNKNVYVLK